MGYLFRLEALKRYRHFQEDTCQKKFLGGPTPFMKGKSRRFRIWLRYATRPKRRWVNEKDKETSGPQMSVYSRYLERLARQITAQHLALNKAREICEEQTAGIDCRHAKAENTGKIKRAGLENIPGKILNA